MSISSIVYVLIVSVRYRMDQVEGVFLDLDVALEAARNAIRKRAAGHSRYDDLEKLIAEPKEIIQTHLTPRVGGKAFTFGAFTDFFANVVPMNLPSAIQAKAKIWLIVTPNSMLLNRLQLQSIYTSFADAITDVQDVLAKFVAGEKLDAVILREPLSSEILAKYDSIEIPTISEDDFMRWNMPSAYGDTDTWISITRFTIE